MYKMWEILSLILFLVSFFLFSFVPSIQILVNTLLFTLHYSNLSGMLSPQMMVGDIHFFLFYFFYCVPCCARNKQLTF